MALCAPTPGSEPPSRSWLLLVPFLVLLIGSTLAWATTASATRLDADASLESVVQGYVENTGVPAVAVAVVHGTEVEVSAHGRGVDEQPVTPETEMRIASLTKTFTATLAAMLARDGTLDLDAPAASYVPGLTLADDRYLAITTRQLLSHRSGLTDGTLDVPSLLLSSSTADFVGRLRGASLAGDPGTEFSYCNANYNLSVAVIEGATGRAFGDVLRDRLLDPLRMTSTSLIDPAGDQGRGWNELLGHWYPMDEPGGYGPGSGGLVSTAHDMGLWMRAQLGGAPDVLSPDVLATVQNPAPDAEYAMGWSLDESGARVHSGNLFTASSAQLARPERTDGVVILTNSASIVDMAYPLMQTLDARSNAAFPRTLELADRLVVVFLAAIVSAGAVGLARSTWWRHRTAGRTRVRRSARSVWLLSPLVLLLGLRHSVEFVTGGRSVRWIEIVHLAPAVVLLVAVAAVAGAVVVAARVR